MSTFASNSPQYICQQRGGNVCNLHYRSPKNASSQSGPSTDDHLYDFPAPHVLLRWPCRCRKRGLPIGYQSIVIRFHSHPTIHGTHRSPILTSSGSWALKTRLGKGRRGTGKRTIGRGVVTWLHNFLVPSLFMFSRETDTNDAERSTDMRKQSKA